RGALPLLRAAGHHSQLLSGVLAYRPRAPSLYAARIYKDLFDVLRRISRRDTGSRADGALDPRQNHTRDQKAGESILDLGVSTAREFRAAISPVYARLRRAPSRAHDFSVQETGQRIHAAAQRRHPALHADGDSGNVDCRGRENFADPG